MWQNQHKKFWLLGCSGWFLGDCLLAQVKQKQDLINILVSVGYGFSVSLLYFFILFTYLDKLKYIKVFFVLILYSTW